MAKGQQAYPERVKARARRWYELDGIPPTAIKGLLLDVDDVVVPVETIKYWVKDVDRGPGLRGGDPWNFDEATPEALLYNNNDKGENPMHPVGAQTILHRSIQLHLKAWYGLGGPDNYCYRKLEQ